MKKIAIIGASYLQEPLITRAKELGYETHVFAWECGDVGEKIADYFYPISIVEKDLILEKCIEIGIDGISSIASDLAIITVNYVAQNMGLISNNIESTKLSTNKHLMRKTFEINGDPSPKSLKVKNFEELEDIKFDYPIIVKPIDRSGSRGITKLESSEGLEKAIEFAKDQGFEKEVLIEEFVTGQEYSVEYLSWQGNHHFFALTKKYTTGAPNFIEVGHIEPAIIDEIKLKEIKQIVEHALTSLGIEYGASHSEIKISKNGVIKIIEIGGRMGGDFIGSALVKNSTGIDFVEQVIKVAMNEEPIFERTKNKASAVRFIISEDDIKALNRVEREHLEYIIKKDVHENVNNAVVDSSTRHGYFLMCADDIEDLIRYMPMLMDE